MRESKSSKIGKEYPIQQDWGGGDNSVAFKKEARKYGENASFYVLGQSNDASIVSPLGGCFVVHSEALLSFRVL